METTAISATILNSLMKPDAYPPPCRSVELIQTHVSWIFLTETHAFKLKKPVNFGFLDFSTLEKRHFYCNEELRLNRRLCPEIYEQVIELRQLEGGAAFHGNGAVIDYAVMMKRLPADRMLDQLVDHGAVDAADLRNVAETVSRFHAGAATSPAIAEFGSVSQIQFNWEENFQQLTPFEQQTLPGQEREALRDYAARFIEQHCELFEQRQRYGFIRECDGDLHLANICLIGERVCIFDCIEFNERFRYGDTAADIAFLLMDLDVHGRPDLAEAFLSSYMAASGDTHLVEITDFYKVYRAIVRGKVATLQLNDPGISADAKQAAHQQSRRYFRLARGYCERSRLRPTLFITCGTTGCGKSALAQQLAFELGLRVCQSDTIRKQLAGLTPETHAYDDYQRGLYNADMDHATYQKLLAMAEYELTAGRSTLIDAGFRTAAQRETAARLAARHAADLVVLLVTCDAQEQTRRLHARLAEPGSVSDGRAELLQPQTRDFEAPAVTEGHIITIPSRAPVDQLTNRIYQELHQW